MKCEKNKEYKSRDFDISGAAAARELEKKLCGEPYDTRFDEIFTTVASKQRVESVVSASIRTGLNRPIFFNVIDKKKQFEHVQNDFKKCNICIQAVISAIAYHDKPEKFSHDVFERAENAISCYKRPGSKMCCDVPEIQYRWIEYAEMHPKWTSGNFLPIKYMKFIDLRSKEVEIVARLVMAGAAESELLKFNVSDDVIRKAKAVTYASGLVTYFGGKPCTSKKMKLLEIT